MTLHEQLQRSRREIAFNRVIEQAERQSQTPKYNEKKYLDEWVKRTVDNLPGWRYVGYDNH